MPVDARLCARESRQADACELVHFVHTRGAVHAGVRAAFVEVDLAVRARPPAGARARVLNDTRRVRAWRVHARGAVHARRRRALLDVRACFATVGRLVARVADALVLQGAHVATLRRGLVAVVLFLCARIDLHGAVVAGPCVRARARVREVAVRAGTAVIARCRHALVEVYVAIVASETLSTNTRV